MSTCPECEAVIDAEFEDVGEIVSCPECGIELEVVSIDPVEFDLAPMDDDEEDDEEDDFALDDSDDDDEWDDEDSYEDEDDEDEY